MEITRKKSGDVIIYEFEGQFDTNTSPDAEREINKDLEEGEFKMILDISKISFVSSAGLRIFLSTNRKISTNKGVFSICGPNDIVKNILQISGFDFLLNVRDSIQESLKDFENESAGGDL